MKYLLVLLIVLVSCGYKPPIKYEYDKTFNSELQPDQTWSVLLNYLNQNDYEVKNYDKAGGFLQGSKKFEGKEQLEEFKDCGSPAFGEFFHGYYENITFLINNNQVTIGIKYKAYGARQNTDYSSTPLEWDCNSKGVREKEISELLRAGFAK